MSFTKGPISAVITDAVGNTINLGNASGAFAAAPQSIVLTDAVGNTLNVGPGVVAVFDATAQQANIADTLLYAVPASAAGMYRVSFYIEVTRAATTSSTLPNLLLSWTPKDSGVAQTDKAFTFSNTANTAGTAGAPNTSSGGFSTTLTAKASTNINVGTANYASSGATPMQYAVHVKLEYLGA